MQIKSFWLGLRFVLFIIIVFFFTIIHCIIFGIFISISFILLL